MRRATISGSATARRRVSMAQTLDRGLRILELLAAQGEGLAVGELATRTGVHRTIIYRLLGTLAAHRLVTRMPDGRYRLGGGLVELARGVAPQLQTVALPILSRLAEDVGATAFLTVAEGNDAVALVAVEPRHTYIHVAYRPGFRHPLDTGASGVAILASRPPRPGERSAVTVARQRGYALSRGEIQPGAVGIAAPVVVAGRPAEASVAVVTLGALDKAAVAPKVMAAAAEIAATMI